MERGGVVALVAALVVAGGTWGYINLVRKDAPDRLTLRPSTSAPDSGQAASPAVQTTGAAGPEQRRRRHLQQPDGDDDVQDGDGYLGLITIAVAR